MPLPRRRRRPLHRLQHPQRPPPDPPLRRPSSRQTGQAPSQRGLDHNPAAGDPELHAGRVRGELPAPNAGYDWICGGAGPGGSVDGEDEGEAVCCVCGIESSLRLMGWDFFFCLLFLFLFFFFIVLYHLVGISSRI